MRDKKTLPRGRTLAQLLRQNKQTSYISKNLNKYWHKLCVRINIFTSKEKKLKKCKLELSNC